MEHRVEGIVLYSYDYKEHSKILKLFTLELGIVSVLLSLKNNNDLILISNQFAQSYFTLVKGRNFFYIKEADIIKSNIFIRKNIYINAYINTLSQLTREILYEENVDKKTYQLLVKAIDLMAFKENPLAIANSFIIKFLSFSGYGPLVSSCVTCRRKTGVFKGFSIDEGGIICASCSQQVDFILSADEILYLNELLFLPMDKISDDRLDREKEYKIFNLLIEYTLKKFDIPKINSLKFLNYLRK